MEKPKWPENRLVMEGELGETKERLNFFDLIIYMIGILVIFALCLSLYVVVTYG